MALIVNKQVQTYGRNLDFANAYAKVENLNGGKNYIQVFVIVRDAKEGVLLSIFETNFVPNMDGGNFIRQAYLHLKTLPEFAGAQDC
jgi:hypothetical protein